MQLEYDPDEILTKEYTAAEVRNYTGSFCGFVLLRNGAYELRSLVHRLQSQWGIGQLLIGDGEQDMMPMLDIMLDMPGAMVTVSLINEPIPDGEAEAAANHAVWSEAKEAVQQHTAHLMAAVLPSEMAVEEAGQLYCKILSAALEDDIALAVYTSGTMIEPKQFQQNMLCSVDTLPLDNLIFVGTYTKESTNGGYTVGMDAFGKDELEIVQSDESAETIAHVLHECARIILTEDAPAQWYLMVQVDGAAWEGRRKDAVMVEGHSIQLKRV